MKPKKLPYKKFLESFKYAPRPAVNLLIEQNIEGSHPSMEGCEPSKTILLTKRRKPPFAGYWHLPGSFILKGESLMDCVKRVAREELEIKVEIEKKNIELVGAFDDISGDPRGHVIDLVYRCQFSQGLTFAEAKVRPFVSKIKPIGDSAEIRFFKKLPLKIGFNHRETLVKLGYK